MCFYKCVCNAGIVHKDLCTKSGNSHNISIAIGIVIHNGSDSCITVVVLPLVQWRPMTSNQILQKQLICFVPCFLNLSQSIDQFPDGWVVYSMLCLHSTMHRLCVVIRPVLIT